MTDQPLDAEHAAVPPRAVAPTKLSNLDQIATVVSSVIADGAAKGMRAIDARVWHGIDLRLLPDRGLDIGAAWFRGIPLAWISANGETRAPVADEMTGTHWRDVWSGGLMTTCGLSNVGEGSDGWGLHGTYTARVAEAVTVDRREDAVEVRAEIEDPPFRVERLITTSVGQGSLRVEDRVTNLGLERAPAPMLYHVNIGVPLWDTGARIETDASELVPLEDYGPPGDDPHVAPEEAQPEGSARVYEQIGARWARVTNPEIGLALTVRSSFPRLWQWVDASSGVYALGLEPANCSVRGRRADLASGEMPFLGPRETRQSWLTIDARMVV